MSMIKVVSGVSTVFDSSSVNQKENILHGIGSVFTIVATGTVGQTATVQGSIDAEHWVNIATFSIETDTDVLSTVQQFSFPYLQVTGDAMVKIARGSA